MSIVRPVHAALLGLAAVALAACATEKPPPEVPVLDFAALPEIRLDVVEMQVVPAYAPSQRRPHVEHLFPTPPQDALERWAREKIKAAGSSRRAMVVIREASVVEIPLKTKRGLTGALTKEPSERYEAVIEVELEIRDDRGERVGWATTRTSRERTVQEGLTEPERKVFWQSLTGQLVEDVAQALSRRIDESLPQFRR